MPVTMRTPPKSTARSTTTAPTMLSIVRNAESSCVRRGTNPSFSDSARYFALVPNTLTRSSAASVQSISGAEGGIGAPSYRTIVAPLASAVTSQFHIIHPQVVK